MTAEDKKKYQDGSYKKSYRIYFPDADVTLTDADIYKDSITLSESIFDGNGELEIVGCISNSFTVEIRNQNRKLKNEKIQLSLSIDGGTTEQIFDGYIYDVETVRDSSYMKLTCYDLLHKKASDNFNKKVLASLSASVTLKEIRTAICTYIGIKQATVTLANDNVTVYKSSLTDEISVLDALKAVCQLNGVFGKVDHKGIMQYIDLTLFDGGVAYPSAATYPALDLYPNNTSGTTTGTHDNIGSYKKATLKYADYKVEKITQVVVRNNDNDTGEGRYPKTLANGVTANTYLIEGNALVKILSSTVKQQLAQSIYNKVKDITYIPFDVTNLGLPFVECGQSVTYYAYDYSSGSAKTQVITFNVMSRYFSGTQAITDNYSAKGSQYQPEVKKAVSSGGGVTPEEVDKLIEDKIDELADDDLIVTPDNIDDFIDQLAEDDKIIIPDDFDDYFSDSLDDAIEADKVATPDDIDDKINSKIEDGTLVSSDELPNIVYGMTDSSDSDSDSDSDPVHKVKLVDIYTTNIAASEGSTLAEGCLLLVYE